MTLNISFFVLSLSPTNAIVVTCQHYQLTREGSTTQSWIHICHYVVIKFLFFWNYNARQSSRFIDPNEATFSQSSSQNKAQYTDRGYSESSMCKNMRQTTNNKISKRFINHLNLGPPSHLSSKQHLRNDSLLVHWVNVTIAIY